MAPLSMVDYVVVHELAHLEGRIIPLPKETDIDADLSLS